MCKCQRFHCGVIFGPFNTQIQSALKKKQYYLSRLFQPLSEMATNMQKKCLMNWEKNVMNPKESSIH